MWAGRLRSQESLVDYRQDRLIEGLRVTILVCQSLVMFSNYWCCGSEGSAELIASHKEANDSIVQEHGFGETHGFACPPLEPCPQRQRFPFDLLRVDLADG